MKNSRGDELEILEDRVNVLHDRLSDIESRIGAADFFIENSAYEWGKSSFWEDWDSENQMELLDEFWTQNAFDYDMYFLRKEKIKIEHQLILIKERIEEILKNEPEIKDPFLRWIRK